MHDWKKPTIWELPTWVVVAFCVISSKVYCKSKSIYHREQIISSSTIIELHLDWISLLRRFIWERFSIHHIFPQQHSKICSIRFTTCFVMDGTIAFLFLFLSRNSYSLVSFEVDLPSPYSWRGWSPPNWIPVGAYTYSKESTRAGYLFFGVQSKNNALIWGGKKEIWLAWE